MLGVHRFAEYYYVACYAVLIFVGSFVVPDTNGSRVPHLLGHVTKILSCTTDTEFAVFRWLISIFEGKISQC
jgi:hypothetical protein